MAEWRGSVRIGGCASADGTRQTPRPEGGERIARKREGGVTKRVGGWRESIALKLVGRNLGNGTICAFPI